MVEVRMQGTEFVFAQVGPWNYLPFALIKVRQLLTS